MAKILITGATGFIGKHLVPNLQTQGHELRAACWQLVPDLNLEQVLINRLEKQTDWSDALENIDIVIHLAAHVHILSQKVDESEFIRINSVATKELAEQAAARGVKRFIFLSSIKVNGEFSSNEPFNELAEANPQDHYAKSKYLAENYLKDVAAKTSMEVVILRPPLVYGPGVKANFLKLIHMVDKGWPLPFAKQKSSRSFIYIQNLVSAIASVCLEPKAANQLFLVADDETWTLAELIHLLAKNLKKQALVFYLPAAPLKFLLNLLGKKDLALRLFGSLEVTNKKIKELTGWEPVMSAEDGIRETIEWYLEKGTTTT